MKREHINYFAVGLFVLAMFAAFFVTMYWVTGRTGPSDDYYVHYANVTGLKFGTGVYYEGFRVGQVEKIEPEKTPGGVRYQLRLSIKRDWQIPDDSLAKIISTGLIAAPQIGIEQGQSSVYLQPGDEIPGLERQNMFSALNDAASELHYVSRNGVMPLLENLSQRVTEISNHVIDFRESQLSPLVTNLDRRLNGEVLVDAAEMMKKLNDSAAQLQQVLGSENRGKLKNFLTHIDDVAINLNDLISRIEQTRQHMNGVLTSLDDLTTGNSERVATTLDNANTSAEEARKMMRTINTHLDSILYHAEGSTRHLHEFSKAIRENPTRLIRGTKEQGDSAQ
ncbi:MAG: MlaD family protein [Gammaproteobacteria bacterium]